MVNSLQDVQNKEVFIKVPKFQPTKHTDEVTHNKSFVKAFLRDLCLNILIKTNQVDQVKPEDFEFIMAEVESKMEEWDWNQLSSTQSTTKQVLVDFGQYEIEVEISSSQLAQYKARIAANLISAETPAVQLLTHDLVSSRTKADNDSQLGRFPQNKKHLVIPERDNAQCRAVKIHRFQPYKKEIKLQRIVLSPIYSSKSTSPVKTIDNSTDCSTKKDILSIESILASPSSYLSDLNSFSDNHTKYHENLHCSNPDIQQSQTVNPSIYLTHSPKSSKTNLTFEFPDTPSFNSDYLTEPFLNFNYMDDKNEEFFDSFLNSEIST